MENLEVLINKEIEQAGNTSLSPELIKLDSYRVTTDSDFQSEEFLLRMQGCPCFPRRDLSAITGQAKSGKTVFITILMSCFTRPKEKKILLDLERIREEPLRVMWFDTEQSPQSTKNILVNRVGKLIGGEFPEELFYVFNIRKAMVDNRKDLISEAVSAFQPDLVIVDNIRDLMKDINDGVQSQDLIEWLMHLAEEFNCHIMTVLHQNRSADNRGLRGWLGTEVMNKVYEVYACQKIFGKPGEKPTFCVEQTHTRKYDIEMPIYYKLNESGMPELSDAPAVHPRDAQGKFIAYQKTDPNKFNRDYIISVDNDGKSNWDWNYYKLFSDAIGNCSTIGLQDLQAKVKELSFIKYEAYLEKVMDAAVKLQVIRIDSDRCGRCVAMLLQPTVSSPSL